MHLSKEEGESIDRVVESIKGGRNKAGEVLEDGENVHETCLCHLFSGKKTSNIKCLTNNDG